MFEPTIFIQHFIYLYKFLNKIDAYKYKFLETGTSDRTLLWVSDQLLGCSLYPRSFFLYSPFNGKNLIKNQENQSRESRKSIKRIKKRNVTDMKKVQNQEKKRDKNLIIKRKEKRPTYLLSEPLYKMSHPDNIVSMVVHRKSRQDRHRDTGLYKANYTIMEKLKV